MNRTIVIAEAGVNHNGNLKLAKELVDAAALAGADYVKFQTFKAESIASKSAAKADYQKANTDNTESQFQMLKKLELSKEDHLELIDYCKQKNIAFLSTAFDLDSIGLLQELGIRIGKIPSGEITNLPYLKKMAETFPELILSTGMASIEEIRDAINVLLAAKAKKENIIVLHCTTEYPTPMEDVNLKAMLSIQQEFGTRIGYSDHTLGIEIPIAAVALGATLIEKHFTLSRSMEGPDHKASLEPAELINMISAIRNIELALGTGFKAPSASEIKNKAVARKSMVAAHALKAGSVLQESDIVMKRPGSGISPMELPSIIGRKLKTDIEADMLLDYKHFE